jgi:CheY-specific phosphatase CheX
MHSELIDKSLKNIFIDIFRTDLQTCEKKDIDNSMYSKIDIFLENNRKETIYFELSKETLQDLITTYMFEENNSDEELLDFCQEFANLIVGRAKVFAQSANKFFDISTPTTLDSIDYDKLSKSYYYDYKGQAFMYGY